MKIIWRGITFRTLKDCAKAFRIGEQPTIIIMAFIVGIFAGAANVMFRTAMNISHDPAPFNAPIAGIMFAVEIVLLGNYELSSFSAIVIKS